MKKRWQGAGAAIAITVLAVMSAEQTGASWRDQAQTGSATVTSGQLRILAGESQNYAWNDFGSAGLAPGSVVQRPLTISVVGDTKAAYRLQSVVPTTSEVPLTLSASIVSSIAGCPPTGSPSSVVAGPWTVFPAPSTARTVQANTSEVWCLRATVGAGALQNKTTKVTLNFRADQQL
ncbi:hypothetical protein [Williamsia sp. 1135]|uniref:hypothetical protein n=1 Tax=Williamsia sp. 1135 TaxID=1889262 RepID=UPI000A122E46|nr:hypothetical protein [Williamsia sp. 1135]ORM36107.1 hypothetical protein BFL43_08045 [Williamsia sp. 1135]